MAVGKKRTSAKMMLFIFFLFLRTDDDILLVRYCLGTLLLLERILSIIIVVSCADSPCVDMSRTLFYQVYW